MKVNYELPFHCHQMFRWTGKVRSRCSRRRLPNRFGLSRVDRELWSVSWWPSLAASRETWTFPCSLFSTANLNLTTKFCFHFTRFCPVEAHQLNTNEHLTHTELTSFVKHRLTSAKFDDSREIRAYC